MIYLTVVIPVRNEEEFINATLEMLASQDYPKDRYEILIVDGASTDRTRVAVKQFIDSRPDIFISLLSNPGRLSSRARNIGVRKAKGELIAVIDGHVFIQGNQLFKNMEKLANENKALCLARPAPLDVPGLKKSTAYWIAMARKSWLGHSRRSYIYSDYEGFVDPVSSGFAYHRSVFEKVGYFDENFDAAEDVEFHFRLKKAGIPGYTSPAFLIYSYPRESFLSLFKQQARYGEGRARFIKKHPDGFTKETPIPAFIFLFVTGFPAALMLSNRLPALGMTYLSILILYVLILLTAGWEAASKQRNPLGGLYVAVGIFVTHMGLGWGFLKRFAVGFMNWG